MKTSRTTALTAALVTLALAGSASAAEPLYDRAGAGSPAGDPVRAPFHLDVETDPTAFVFRGFSLHVGLGYEHVRLDLGAYGMDVPGFAQSNEGFDASFHGAGAKLQLFVFDEQKGGFIGVDAGLTHLRADLRGTGRHGSQDQVGAGVNVGWRFSLPYGLYVTPWLGVGYALGARDMTIGGKTYRAEPVTVFPAVHLGYRFM